MRSLSSCALPVRIDHPRNAELILFVGPAKRHYHIRASAIIDLRLLERERSIHRFAREDHTREIRLLKKSPHPPCDGDVVPNHIKQTRPAVSGQHDLARLRFPCELRHRVESGVPKDFWNVDLA